MQLLEACAPGLADPEAHTVVDHAMDEDGEPVEPIDALVELALEVLQRPSALLRTVTEQAFAVFAGRLKRESLQLVLDVRLSIQVKGEADHDARPFCPSIKHQGSRSKTRQSWQRRRTKRKRRKTKSRPTSGKT